MTDHLELHLDRELRQRIGVLHARVGELLEANDPAALFDGVRLLRRSLERAEEQYATLTAYARRRGRSLSPGGAELLARVRKILDELEPEL
jgi:hypothetical protein